MAPFSPLPPLWSPHSRFARPNSRTNAQLPSRPFSHIFGQAKPQVKRYKSASQILCGCSTESKTWMLGLGLVCLAVVGWLASLPAGEALSRGVLVELRLETDGMGASWDVSGPRTVDFDPLVSDSESRVVSPYAPGEIEIGKKRKVVFGHPETLELPFDMIVPPNETEEAPSNLAADDERRPMAQEVDDRSLERPQPSKPSPFSDVEPMYAKEPFMSTAAEPTSSEAISQPKESGAVESEAEEIDDTPSQAAGETQRTRAQRTKLGRRSRTRSTRR